MNTAAGEEGPSVARQVAGQVARQAGRQVARQVGRAALSLGGKAAAVLGGKVLAIAVAVVIVLIVLLGIIIGGLSAVFQQSTAPWPAIADARPDGSYDAGGWAITERFGWRRDPRTNQVAFHDGIDIAHPEGRCSFGMGCPLVSMFDGEVRYVGWDTLAEGDPTTNGGGQIVVIENGSGEFETTYAHLEPFRLHVQLQGKIVDEYGRYDDESSYAPLGEGERTPSLDAASLSIWCAGDMPQFVPTRSGATVTFLYDRPAQGCRASVTWPTRDEEGWEGWIADDPPADRDGTATLAWQTPLNLAYGPGPAAQANRAGDVALRFRAHLEPPPPPPTETPVISDTTEIEGQVTPVVGCAGGLCHVRDDSAAAVQCAGHAGGTRCTWTLGGIPSAPAAAALATTGRGAVAPHLAIEATATPPALSAPGVGISASRGSVPSGGRVSFSISVFGDGEQHVTVDLGGGFEIRDVASSGGACRPSGTTITCTTHARPTSSQTIGVVADVRPEVLDQTRLTVEARVAQDGATASDRVIIVVAGVVVTPAPWPPPTAHPTATPPPAPTQGVVFPTFTPPTPGPSPTPVPPPPGSGPGASPLTCAPLALESLPNVVNAHGSSGGMQLASVAASSFAAVRAEIVGQTGRDPLARLADGLRLPEFRSNKPGVALMSWHMTGRAIDLDQGVSWRRVREGAFWRLYLGATDVTAIFARHGWSRIPDRADSPEWWHYEYRPDGIAWTSAMLQVWPLARLQAAFPQIAWGAVGCQSGAGPGVPGAPTLDPRACVPLTPSFSSPVEELAGCGPPLRAGDRVYQLDSIVGFVGVSGMTTGPHLHLGLRARSYTGAYPFTPICTPEWLNGLTPPADAACETDMADPLAFLPLAPPDAVVGGVQVIENAPYQLPPPGYPGSLYDDGGAGDQPPGQYWSPFSSGGRFGGGGGSSGTW